MKERTAFPGNGGRCFYVEKVLTGVIVLGIRGKVDSKAHEMRGDKI